MMAVNVTTIENRTIALAGVCQAVALVHRLATSGYLPKPEFHACMYSLLQQNPESVLGTYGGLSELQLGLKTLNSFLTDVKSEQQYCFRYLLGVMHLQSKLQKHRDLLDIIGSRLGQINQQAAHFEPTHDNVIANLADLYSDTISKFRFRIQVRGDACYLQQQRIANQVRSLLFSAIRSSILWQQTGGRRWHLLVYRKSIVKCAQDLLKKTETPAIH